MQKGERYDDLEELYREVTKQYTRYINHVVSYIGGIEYTEIRQGDGQTQSMNYINKVRQKEALTWLLAQMRSYDSWLTPHALLNKLELSLDANKNICKRTISSLFNPTALYRIKEGGMVNANANYTIEGYMNDLTNMLFKAPVGGKLSYAEQALQSNAISLMMQRTGLQPETGKKTKGFTDDQLWQNDLEMSQQICNANDMTDSFVRINYGGSMLSDAETGALMTGSLQRVLNKYRAYRATATGSTRDFYSYQILLMEKLLNNK